MTQASVAADLLQPFDVLRTLAPQIALDREAVVDRVAQLCHLVLGEVAHIRVGAHPHLREDLVRGRAPDPVYVGEANLGPLVQRKVDSGNTCHWQITPGAACDACSGRSPAPPRGGG